jgi:Ni/Fe-hydrogenase subunit HybB-like protein
MIPGITLAILTAIYTAYLFAQAKARDLWQNPLLPPHLLVQALLLGSAVMLLFATLMRWTYLSDRMLGAIAPDLITWQWIVVISSLLHLSMIWGEMSLTHSTSHARLAIWEMMSGRYKNAFWAAIALSVIGGAFPLLAILSYVTPSMGLLGALLALIGVMLYEHAYVQAGQSVPLA